MSQKNANEFYNRLREDEELKERMKDVIGISSADEKTHFEDTKEELKEKILSAAKELGLDFTWEELQQTNSEIPDEELEYITAGLRDNSGRLLTTVGYGCSHWVGKTHELWYATSGHCGSCACWSLDLAGRVFVYVGGVGACNGGI